jgi:hypothetical protein
MPTTGNGRKAVKDNRAWLMPLADMAEKQMSGMRGGENRTEEAMYSLRSAVHKVAMIADMGSEGSGRENASKICSLLMDGSYSPSSVNLIADCLLSIAERESEGPGLSKWLDLLEKCKREERFSFVIELGKCAMNGESDLNGIYSKAARAKTRMPRVMERLNIDAGVFVLEPMSDRSVSLMNLSYEETAAVQHIAGRIMMAPSAAGTGSPSVRTLPSRRGKQLDFLRQSTIEPVFVLNAKGGLEQYSEE